VKIVVLIKQVPDTWGERKLDPSSGWIDRTASDTVIDEVGERALEAALSFKDANDAEVVALSMGPASAKDVLRKALAMGADSAVHVLDDSLAGADLLTTAGVLSAAIDRVGFDLVIAGNESTDGRGGVVPAMIAERLGVPHATHLNSLQISMSDVTGERSSDYGAFDVRAALPAIVSLTERAPEPRFPNFKGIMRAKKKPLEVIDGVTLDAVHPSGAGSVILTSQRSPARAAGTRVADDGTAADALVDFLFANNLV